MNCPLCHSSFNQFKFKSQNIHGHHFLNDQSKKFMVYQCQKCQTIYLNNITINQQYYNQYYQHDYYLPAGNILTKFYYKLFSQNNSPKLLKLLKSNKKIKILDIGCGDGSFLSSLPDNRFIKYGLDTNPDAIKICLSKNINTIPADITSKIPTSTTFDIITLNHVFEHISHPDSSLKNIYRILKPKGYLLITVPLSNSLGFRLGKKFWFHLDSPRHLFIPSCGGLVSYLAIHNYKTIQISHQPFEYPLDLFWSIKNNPCYWPLLIFYPLLKLFDWETATFVCQKH